MWHLLVGGNSQMFTETKAQIWFSCRMLFLNICTLVAGTNADCSQAVALSSLPPTLRMNAVCTCQVLWNRWDTFPSQTLLKTSSYAHILGLLVIWTYICNTFGFFEPYPFLRSKTLTLQLFTFQKQLCSFISQTEKAYSTYIIFSISHPLPCLITISLLLSLQ